MIIETKFRKLAGIGLAFGSVLATLTMALHPLGGTLAAIAKMSNSFIFTHGMAIFCIPFIAFGFWGLSTVLITKSRMSFLAFSVICFGLVAVLIAGTIDGFVLPSFASKYANSSVDNAILHSIRTYGFFINLAFDYIFIGAFSVALLIWSCLIIYHKQLPVWLGYYGLLIVLSTVAAVLLKFNLANVFGFSLYIFGIVSWKIVAGIVLMRSSKEA